MMQAPRIPKMFGIYTKKPSQFEYTPRYYDERKEKLDKRVAQIKQELNNEKNNSQRTDFKSSIGENWGATYRNRSTNAINKRVIIYLVVLLGLTYYLIH